MDCYFKCFYCGTSLGWEDDANIADLLDLDLDEYGTVSFFHCPNCGRSYEIYEPLREEKENDYKDYWGNDV